MECHDPGAPNRLIAQALTQEMLDEAHGGSEGQPDFGVRRGLVAERLFASRA